MKTATEAQRAALAARAREIAGALGPLAWTDAGLAPEGRERLAREAGRILRESRAVGACLVLAGPGFAETLCFGRARLLPPAPVTERTCFRVASVTKVAVAAGFLSLCEAGLLSLDMDAGETLGFALRHPRFPARRITPRMLLTHTSGLRDEGPYGAQTPTNALPLSALTAQQDSWTAYAPGERFHYSNLGYGALGLVMERACGQPLDAILRERLFDPLDMRAALDPRRIMPPGDLADGYRVRPYLPPYRRYAPRRQAKRLPEAWGGEQSYFAGAGRMLLDSGGMAAFLRFIASREDTPALSAASLAALRGDPQEQCGRGLGLAQLPGVFPGFPAAYGHQGTAYGMLAEAFADVDSGCGVGLMANGIRLDRRREPLVAPGLDLVALGFAALAGRRTSPGGGFTFSSQFRTNFAQG